jgi:hypothetical protein
LGLVEVKVKMCNQEFGVKKFIWLLKEILSYGMHRNIKF